MKRLLFAALIGTAALVSFSSCKKEYITQEVNVLDGVTFSTNVKSSSWVADQSGYSFSNELDFPELDAKYFNFGHVGVAISFDNDKDFFINIPSAVGPYNYRVEYKIGKVYLYADYVGNDNKPVRPTDMFVKVTLTDATNGGN
ncbi:hypothetical protein [Sphingobacterium detergens]|uniref:Uncharacterized protein n=1 Tax=Sphingobacterium detergens TaxID=1145106 RepID=A0A420B8R9_SPHD1|nr:hypothetical protein [Sphingobacterium detergens]RKE52999.1 hypothetical protein DFQ12_3246 [Sphingobacterium detergens]